MKLKHKYYFWFLAAIFILSALFNFLSYYQGETYGIIANVVYLFTSFAAFGACILLAKAFGFKNPHGQSFFAISLVFLLWFMADFIWIAGDRLTIDLLRKAADPFYFVAYIPLTYGLFKELKLAVAKWREALLKPEIIIYFLATLLVIAVGTYSNMKTFETDFWSRIFNNIYILADVVLVQVLFFSIILRREYRYGKINQPWSIIFAGIFLTLLADMFYLIAANQYLAKEIAFSCIDTLYAASYLTFAYGFLRLGELLQHYKEGAEKLEGGKHT